MEILSSVAFVEERYRGRKGMHCTEMLAERHRGICKRHGIGPEDCLNGRCRYWFCTASVKDR